MTQLFTLLTELLGVSFVQVGLVEALRFLQGLLLVRVDVDFAALTFLAHVGPAVARHPNAATSRTPVLAETTGAPLVRRFPVAGTQRFVLEVKDARIVRI